jgi:hypothetical protein
MLKRCCFIGVKTKSFRVERFVKRNVNTFQEMTAMLLFYGSAYGNRM